MKVSIGPSTYEVVTKPANDLELIDGGVQYTGRSNHVARLITISEELNAEHFRDTLIHEIVHAIMVVYGFDEPEEGRVVLLATAISLLLKDNEWILRLYSPNQPS